MASGLILGLCSKPKLNSKYLHKLNDSIVHFYLLGNFDDEFEFNTTVQASPKVLMLNHNHKSLKSEEPITTSVLFKTTLNENTANTYFKLEENGKISNLNSTLEHDFVSTLASVEFSIIDQNENTTLNLKLNLNSSNLIKSTKASSVFSYKDLSRKGDSADYHENIFASIEVSPKTGNFTFDKSGAYVDAQSWSFFRQLVLVAQKEDNFDPDLKMEIKSTSLQSGNEETWRNDRLFFISELFNSHYSSRIDTHGNSFNLGCP